MRIEISQPGVLKETMLLMIFGTIVSWFSLADPVFAQDQTSLGEVARQSRTSHRTTEKDSGSEAGGTAQRWASSIQQQQEETGTTPDGFGTYLGPGYQVWVPAPFSVIGRNDAGTLLGTSEAGGLTTKVFAGNPIPMSKHTNDREFSGLASEFWRQYGTLTCSHQRPGSTYHDCAASANLLGFQGFGSARFVENGDEFLPIVCFATREDLETVDLSRAHSREERMAEGDKLWRNNERQERVATSGKVCATVLESIRIRQVAETPETQRRSVKTTEALTTPENQSAAVPDLVQIARESKIRAQSEKAKLSVQEEDTAALAPPGFGAHSDQLCAKECWDESFFLPDGARRVKGGKSENVYVETRGDLTKAIFYFGATGAQYEFTEFGGAQDVARQWIHAIVDYKTQPVRVNHTINGQTAVLVRSRLLSNLVPWTEEQAIITLGDYHIRIGCILPEDHFIDNEATCSAVFESWKVHR